MKIISAFVLLALASCSNTNKKHSTWRVTGGSKENIHFSSLTQIDTSNVKQLQVAWTYHTADADTANHSQIQCNPIEVDGVLYGTTPQLKLFALDASTGKEKWVFDPQAEQKNQNVFFCALHIKQQSRCHLLGRWKGRKEFYNAAGSFLYSIDVLTGKPDSEIWQRRFN